MGYKAKRVFVYIELNRRIEIRDLKSMICVSVCKGRGEGERRGGVVQSNTCKYQKILRLNIKVRYALGVKKVYSLKKL